MLHMKQTGLLIELILLWEAVKCMYYAIQTEVETTAHWESCWTSIVGSELSGNHWQQKSSLTDNWLNQSSAREQNVKLIIYSIFNIVIWHLEHKFT